MDLSAVNWLNLVVLTASTFLAAFIGSFIGRRNYVFTAFLTAIIFAAFYVGWAGYLKQQFNQIVTAPQPVETTGPVTPKPPADTTMQDADNPKPPADTTMQDADNNDKPEQ